VTLVAASFGWPFRGAWPSRFFLGVLMVLLLPIAFIPLLGYAIAATRGAEGDPRQSPPPWVWSARLLVDGFWTALAVLLLSAPFIAALKPLGGVIGRAVPQPYSQIAAIFLLALPWGLLLLLLMPHGASRYAASGRPLDLFNFPASLRGVKRDFPVWNIVAAAMVTAWILAIASVGLLCVGILPGTFYAILVSAHAAATLHQTTGPARTNPPAG
jgi:hypothetical protein